MDMNQAFKEKVAIAAITNAPLFKATYVEYEYLLCSAAFKGDYYILMAHEDNYQHLIGVHTPNLTPQEFFDRCMGRDNVFLTEADFDFIKKNRTEKEVKGSVRKKMKAFPYYLKMISTDLVAQENFKKNAVQCSFATTDCNMTIGYIDNEKAVPRSLMLNDKIDWSQAEPVDLILRRPRGAELFSKIVFGDTKTLMEYRDKIEDMVEPELFSAEPS